MHIIIILLYYYFLQVPLRILAFAIYAAGNGLNLVALGLVEARTIIYYKTLYIYIYIYIFSL